MQTTTYAKSITVAQLCMLMFTTAGVMDHVIIIPMLLRTAKRDAWISVLFAGVILCVGVMLLYVISRNTAQQHLGDWFSERGLKWLWGLLLILIIPQLFLMSSVTVRDTCFWAKTMYMPETPMIWIVAVLAFGCYLTAKSGISTIAISNGILLPIIIVLGIFVAVGNIPHKNYEYLRPVMENGFPPVFHGMLFAGAAFAEMILVLFLQPFVKNKIHWYVLLIIAIGLIGLTIGPLIGGIAEFGPYEAARQRYTPYEEWRLLTFKHFIEHVDFFSIYQWLAGAFIRISLAMFLIPEMLQLRNDKKMRNRVLLVVLLSTAAVAIYPASDESFFWFVEHVYLPLSLLATAGIFLIVLISSLTFRLGHAR